MRIEYKKPYWLKFNWDLKIHNNNQYVTEFNKLENKEIDDFLFNKKYAITVKFLIKEEYIKDEICMIYGKPGKNMGLTYNKSTNVVAFEFWTHDNKFHFLNCEGITKEDIQKGVVITIIRNNQKFIIYKNFEISNQYTFEHELVEDYRNPGLFLGCSSPQSEQENTRYYGEMDINHFSIIKNTSNIKTIKDFYYTETHKILFKKYYNNILCFYDFKTINNIGIVFDESKNTNFLERVPKEFVL